MPILSKSAFVAALADTRHWRRVDAVLATLAQSLIAGQRVRLPGLGTFSLKERAACSGRSPATGETRAIPAKRTLHCKVARDLQRQIPQPE